MCTFPKTSSRWLRSGLTLVELLVVIAIIGILIALLLPAIQAAREASRRSACSNHLRQFGVAAQNYVSTHKNFPTGGLGFRMAGDPDKGFGANQPGGWLYSILPYIEYNEVHDLGKGLKSTAKEMALTAAIETMIPMYYCPSRPRPEAVEYTTQDNPYNNASKPRFVVRNDYAASAGSDKPRAQPDLPDAIVKGKFSSNGITLAGIEVRTRSLTDGAGKTLLYSEKAINAAYVADPFGDGDNDQGWNLGYDWDIIRWTDTTPTADQMLTNRTDFDQFRGSFGAAHSSGLQCVMADCSVQSISFEVNGDVFELLGSRSDGKIIDPTWHN